SGGVYVLGPGHSGSLLGMIHGFTQRGCTGVIVPVGPLPMLAELEALKASAVAVAVTVFPVFPHMREKNVGRFDRVTCAVTRGFTRRRRAVRNSQPSVRCRP